MEILVIDDVASVTLFTIKVSESEMQAYESCIAYVLEHLAHAEIENVTGHMRDELAEVHQGEHAARKRRQVGVPDRGNTRGLLR